MKAVILDKTEAGKIGRIKDGGAESAVLLSELGWTESTWKNRTSQIRKWLTFCYEEGRQEILAEEGDVLSYMGYIYLEVRVGPKSARKYVTAMSRYKEDAEYDSSTKSSLIANIITAYEKKVD